MKKGHVVYVVAKSPQPGVSKTRLYPPLEPVEAAELAAAFIDDAIESVREAACVPRVLCRDAAERRALRRMVGRKAEVATQSGSGLGAALLSAFVQGFRDGFADVAVLGSDSPTLPPVVLREAFCALGQGADVVLGPSDDGGYYLLAARTLHPQLFSEMPWSTDSVANLTLARCASEGLATHRLTTWYDVDDLTSLQRLEVDLRQSRADGAGRTRATMERLAKERGRSMKPRKPSATPPHTISRCEGARE
ncbi:MAG: DUF2064 domain-containing protein [Chloroflexi bacterium]|nr:DUF2064 domain-containing protein [Chloroflexota bacterium]